MISVEFRDWVNEKVLQYLPTQSQRNGDKIMCRCPLCGDSKKNSLKKRGYYYLKTASYHCFNCDENLSGMKLLERLSGEDYNSLKEEYFKMMYDGKHFNGTKKIDTVKNVRVGNIMNLKSVVKKEWKKELTPKATEYLKNRKVLEAPFLKEKLYSYINKKGEEYILIPWKINGIECYYQINDFEKHNKTGMKYIFPKSMDKMIYGLDNIDINKKYIIVTEGVYDSLFIPNCICVGGRKITDFQLNIIKKRYPNHKIYLSFDNDKSGIESMTKSLTDDRYNFGYFIWFNRETKEKDINEFILNKNDTNFFIKNISNNMFKDKLLLQMELLYYSK